MACTLKRTLISVVRGGLAVVLIAAGCLLGGESAPAQNGNKIEAAKQGPVDGMFVTVSNPINERVITLIKKKVEEAVKSRKIQTVVFDFNPGGEQGSTSDASMGMNLMWFIEKLRLGGDGFPGDLQTVAFVHGEVSRHALLPVLACQELVMSKGATLGPIASGQDTMPAAVRAEYEKLGKAKHAEELVQRMLSGKKVSTDEAHNVDIKLCDRVYETREELADALDLPTKSLKENWLATGVKLAAHVPLQGTVDQGNLSSLQRRVKAAIRDGKNLIFLELDCEGGDTTAAAPFLDYLKTRQDRNGFPLTIIAWVPPHRCLGAATYLAVGCSEIVMGEGSCLGDFTSIAESRPADAAFIGTNLAELAQKQHYPGLLFRAAADPSLTVYRVEKKKTGARSLMTKEEYEKEKLAWNLKGELPKNLARIGAELAHEFDVAAATEINTPQQLYAHYGVDPAQVRVYRDDWLDRVAEFFRQPVVKLILLLIGITGLILEVKMPGTTLPGIVAAVCFVLFFWSHSFVNQFTMLAVLLFILGVVLLALEIFVFPGFGLPGIAGLLLLVVAVVLATVEKMPETPQDWRNLVWSLGIFCLSAVGAIFLAISIVSFLPQIPYANRLMLKPPEEGEEDAGPISPFAPLLGAIGMAETPLRPAGKARFGDDYLDVISEGDFVTPGCRVQVIEIEGNRIVVKQV